MRDTTLERFLPKIEYGQSGCWVWQGALAGKEYGYFWNGIKTVYAHRFAYEYFNQTEIPTDREIDHLCRNHSCVNPVHLELVTRSQNMLRGDIEAMSYNKKKTQCPQGHPYSGSNTYIYPNGYRRCRICQREHQIQWKQHHLLEGIE